MEARRIQRKKKRLLKEQKKSNEVVMGIGKKCEVVPVGDVNQA